MFKSIAGALTGGALGLIGGERANKAAAASARAQMDFQERMRDTSYQAGMEDMRKAGLNPILAYKQGGASVPSGAQYQPRNIGEAAVQGANSAMQIQNMRATNENLYQQNDNLKADETLTRENARRLQLENEAYSQLSPEMRAIVLSGGGISSAAAASRIIGRGVAQTPMHLRSLGRNVTRGSANFVKSIRNIFRRK